MIFLFDRLVHQFIALSIKYKFCELIMVKTTCEAQCDMKIIIEFHKTINLYNGLALLSILILCISLNEVENKIFYKAILDYCFLIF